MKRKKEARGREESRAETQRGAWGRGGEETGGSCSRGRQNAGLAVAEVVDLGERSRGVSCS